MLLVPKNHGMIEILIGVIAIGGLFLINKYLIEGKLEEKKESESIPDNII